MNCAKIGFLAMILILAIGSAMSQAPICDVTCTPDPSNPSYPGAVAARPKLLNARGFSSTIQATAGPQEVPMVVGSQSYNYVIPILSLPGRAGMDLNLNLYYNSRVWDIDTVNGTATFNADRDFPSYGFRLDFGYLEYDPDFDEYVLTERDGTKRALPNNGGYNSIDGSFINYNPATGRLAYKNGLILQFSTFQSPDNLYYPSQIKDTNGNFISITYVRGHLQLIDTITDTLGRVITFHYDPVTNQLSYIDQALVGGGVHRYATFTWSSLYGSGYHWYNFTGFTVGGAPDFNTPLNVLTSCTYANQTGYRFTYGDWAVIKKIENLSASVSPVITRSYVNYNFPAASAGALSDAPAYTQETMSPDNTNTSVWNYSASMAGTGIVAAMQVTDPMGGITVSNFDQSTGLISSEQVKDSSGNLLNTSTYSWTASGGATVPASITTTLNDTGQQSSVQYSNYDAFGNPGDVYEYDFGGQLLRHTTTAYKTGSYITQHILNLPMQVLVKDGSGNIISRTDMAYDDYASNPLVSVTGAAHHDDQSFGTGFTTRGNLTSTTRYADAAGGTGGIVHTTSYDTLGNIRTAQLDCCNQKTVNFMAATQYAYANSIVTGPSGLQFTTSATYNFDNGLLLSSTDENGQVTNYQYDSMNRPTVLTPPLQGSTTVTFNTAYDDTALSPTVTKSALPATVTTPTTVATLDGMGHLLRTDVKNGTTLVSSTTISYDKLGRSNQKSNPFGPNETPLYTAFLYDALGRPKQVTPPSGGFTSYSYSGNTTIVSDPAGKQRKQYFDSLGRMVQVDEPGDVASHIPANNYATMQTDGNFVLYDPFNNALWSTGTYGTNAGPIYVQDDGNLVLYLFKWQAGTYAAPSPGPFPAASCSIGTYLMINQRINANQCVVSPHGQYFLYMASDGNFFIYDQAQNIGTWGPGTYGHPGAYAIMQGDGNLCVYDANNIYLWCSGTNGTNAERLNMEDDGRIIIYKSVWSSGTSNGNFNQTNIAHPACDVGNSGIGWTGVLGTGSCIVSPNGHYELLMQTDGNLVLNDLGVTPAQVLWSTGTALTPLSLDVAFHTTYTYDPLGNLTGVSQAAITGQANSAQVRSYVYDGLGRVTRSTTPESGVVTNDYIGGCASDPSLVCHTTDARNVIKTFSYDGINRPTGISFSDGTSPVTYTYDTGGAAASALLRLTKITEGPASPTPVNSHTFTYDNLGRVLTDSQSIDQKTYLIRYAYNLAGDLTSVTYPSGRQVTQNYDSMGRLSSLVSGSTTYLNSLTYNAAGQTLGLTFGNGVQGQFGYNDHLQISTLRYFKNTADMLNLAYNYSAGVSGNNGQIQQVHYYTSPGVEDTTKSENFTYDSVGRLSAAQTGTVSATAGTWSLQWTYDRFGNRLSQSLVGGNVTISQPQLTVDTATNRIVGYTYDAAGNLTNDGGNSYSYDGANRLTRINAGPPRYTYFGPLRIKKVAGSTTTVYIYSGSEPIAEYVNGSTSPSVEYIRSNSGLVASIAGSTTTYHHPDVLSNRTETTTSTTPVRTFGHFPFGEKWYETGTADKWKFTSYEADTGTGETGLQYAQFRYLASGPGRFMTVDLFAGSAGNPQSLNRYSYVANDPVNARDPQGAMTGNFRCLLDSHGDCVGGDYFGGCPTIDGFLDEGCMGGNRFLNADVFAPCNSNNCIFNDEVGLVQFDSLLSMSNFESSDCGLNKWDGEFWCGMGTDNPRMFSGAQQLPLPFGWRPAACNGVSADDLDYDTKSAKLRGDGTNDTGGEHIYKYHIDGNPAIKSQYTSEYPVPVPKTAMLPFVVGINAQTFMMGTATQSKPKGNIVFTYRLPQYPFPIAPNVIATGVGRLPGGKITAFNTLVLSGVDCKFVVTSHPGLP